MTLWENIQSLPAALLKRFGWQKATDAETLNERITVGAEVLAVINTPGMEAIRRETDKLDKAMLEEIASVEVKDWAEYVELRGRLTGFRFRQDLPRQLMKQAADADTELKKQAARH
jgi:hypothetical protein